MIVIAIILIISASLLLVTNFRKAVIGAQVNENIVMNLSELKVCCTYLDEQGDEKSCIIKERFNCSLCESRCSTS